ncbi:MAG: cyclopropane-fatty-acyl-phospholipid synthase family protein [Bacteroidota bacterium]
MQALTVTNRRAGFYENSVIAALSKMTKGCLEITLPNGEFIQIGDEHATLKADIHIKYDEFFKALVLYGDIGFGEAYVDGLWETSNITKVIKWVLLNIDHAPSVSGSSAKSLSMNLFKWVNRIYHNNRSNSISGSQKNISEHYDLSNEFFATFLDPTMTYSAGYFFEEGMSLEASQYAKYQRLCDQLHIKKSDHVLEIGSGWGGNAIYMAKYYGCKVTSITISKEQQKFAVARVAEEGLSDLVDIVIRDYRDLTGSYDKIVSIEMIEAVGHNYYEEYFAKVDSLLKPDGIFAFQVITSPDSRYNSLRKGVDWIQKHIFPGSLLPSVAKLNESINNTSELTMVDLKDMGLDYARTLKLWYDEFNSNIAQIKAMGYSEKFIRKWRYYFNYCEAAFEMRNISVMQMVYVRPNNTGR